MTLDAAFHVGVQVLVAEALRHAILAALNALGLIWTGIDDAGVNGVAFGAALQCLSGGFVFALLMQLLQRRQGLGG